MSTGDDEPTRALPSTAPGGSATPASPAPVEGATPVGRYELLFELAAGGMATVFVGRQRGAGGFQRLCAVKRMHAHLARIPSQSAAFIDEARIASLIRHPNVVSVHDVHQADAEQMLVMDYIDGESLHTVMRAARRRGTRIPRPAALHVVASTLHGLHAAHEQTSLEGTPLGVVHRDATPHNILLGADGSVRITDFGIAKAAERSVHTDTGLAKGKFRYMAPEQARGGALDRRVDVFAMGVVLWELLTGERLWKGQTDAEVLLAVSACQVEPPRKAGVEVPAGLEAVVMKALSAAPDDRHPTAEAFAQALLGWARETGELVAPSEVARLVEELCGADLKKRRELLADVLAGRRPALVPAARGQDEASGSSSTLGASAAHTLDSVDSVKVAARVTDADLVRVRRRRAALLLASALLLAVVAGSAGVWLGAGDRGEAAPSGSAAATSGAPSAPSVVRVHIELGSDTEIAEVRASGISEIEFRSKGAAFDLPRSGTRLTLHVRFADGSEAEQSLIPKESTAIRVLPVVAPSALPPQRPASKAAPALRRAPADLEKNPYE